MLATVIEREHNDTKHRIYESRLEPNKNRINRRFEDLPPHNKKEADLKPNEWTVLENIDATSAKSGSPEDRATYKYSTKKSASWKVGIGIPIPGLAELNFGIEVSRSNEFVVTYKIPFGRHYSLYSKVDELPIAPLCIAKGQ
jgi:hypothetical protein